MAIIFGLSGTQFILNRIYHEEDCCLEIKTDFNYQQINKRFSRTAIRAAFIAEVLLLGQQFLPDPDSINAYFSLVIHTLYMFVKQGAKLWPPKNFHSPTFLCGAWYKNCLMIHVCCQYLEDDSLNKSKGS